MFLLLHNKYIFSSSIFFYLLHTVFEVEVRFLPSQCEMSPEDIFTVEIKNSDKVRMEDKMMVKFSGSYIPFN